MNPNAVADRVVKAVEATLPAESKNRTANLIPVRSVASQPIHGRRAAMAKVQRSTTKSAVDFAEFWAAQRATTRYPL